MAQMFDGAKLILTNGVISDFDEENFDECFCVPLKHAIILLLLCITACSYYCYCHSSPLANCTHLQTHVASYQIKMLKGQINYLLVCWAFHRTDLKSALKYISKDILALSLKVNTILISTCSHVSHKHYKQRHLYSFNLMQNIDRENFDGKA